ncbi:hypothetical protein CARUB_v10007149mg [Capsella rubella]|uniref:Uncharacterized protein n=1 Tax=Capsella rubella TaxID=81985 RepID=R0GGA2_9BRAS|nr:uncharacterized WD repeat-containing protein C17D11.16 [Capsella rubella]EOA15794.1 hypothetical protein CARUB_v10007149mg [Capsella rubella]
MISAFSWVPKGAAKATPDRAKIPSKEEIEKLKKSYELYDEEEEEDAETDDDEVAHAMAIAKDVGIFSKSKNASSSMEVDDEVADGLKELDMDNYDEEDDGIEIFSSGRGDLYYASNEMDPYLNNNDDGGNDSDDDQTISPTDLVIACVKSDRNLEIYVYEETSNGSPNVYSHRQIMLSKTPLCTAWLDCPLKGGEKGNFLAVGSFGSPKIEIWDLDIRDDVLPCVELGGKNKERKYKECSHTRSVLGLAWNMEFRNMLASASADKQVKVWDVATRTCQITMAHHTDKVQAVAWNHHAPEVLLSGSFDRTVVLTDVRKPSHSGFKWSVNAEVESLAWDPHSEHSFVVSLDNGTVKGFDIRQASTSTSDLNPSFIIQHGTSAVTSVSYNISAPNLLATGSTDNSVKLWDLSNNEPSCIATHTPNAGGLFNIAFSPDNPFLLAMGGSEGELKFWDTLSDAIVSGRYGTRPVQP